MKTVGFLVIALLAVLTGCDEKPSGPAPSRFASVKKNAAASAAKFCDSSYPASGDGVKAYFAPQLRPFGNPAPKPSGWKWVNLWATWCKPCVEEMGMLNRWSKALEGESLPVSFELVSIDETAAQPELEQWKSKNLPGSISWMKSDEALGLFLDGLQVDRSSAIPIHVLVDPKNNVRCVRVGAIHEENYGSVRDLIAGG